jgi:hypothetical protein
LDKVGRNRVYPNVVRAVPCSTAAQPGFEPSPPIGFRRLQHRNEQLAATDERYRRPSGGNDRALACAVRWRNIQGQGMSQPRHPQSYPCLVLARASLSCWRAMIRRASTHLSASRPRGPFRINMEDCKTNISECLHPRSFLGKYLTVAHLARRDHIHRGDSLTAISCTN